MTEQEADRDPHDGWAWFDRWTGQFLQSESYPAIWDEMETDEFKPIIVSWEGSADV